MDGCTGSPESASGESFCSWMCVVGCSVFAGEVARDVSNSWQVSGLDVLLSAADFRGQTSLCFGQSFF